jgi:DNA-binding MarR family transcriptional regulator
MSLSSADVTRDQLIDALNRALRETSGMSVLFSQRLAERMGINSTDMECLDFVLLRGPMTAGALAQATGLTTGAITGVVDRLERAGLACRERDAADRRKVMVRALPGVEERAAPLTEPMQRAVVRALGDYSDAELALLLDFMTRARDAWAAVMAETGSSATPSVTGTGSPA